MAPIIHFIHSFIDLLNTDSLRFKNFMRMDFPAFEDLLSLVQAQVIKQATVMRTRISARERLYIYKIHYLATGMHGLVKYKFNKR